MKTLRLLACLLIVSCSGCVRVVLPDGTEYLRVGNQQIGEALLTLPDGTELLFEGQKSEVPHVTLTLPVGGITVGKAVSE